VSRTLIYEENPKKISEIPRKAVEIEPNTQKILDSKVLNKRAQHCSILNQLLVSKTMEMSNLPIFKVKR